MPYADPDHIANLRALAERLRRHASETELAVFREKFQRMAAELDEAATIAEGKPAAPFMQVS